MKYELIKKYPGSPKLGDIVSLKRNGGYELENSTSYFMTKDKVENYPEFWQPVVEKQPLFTTEDGVDIYEGDTVWHVNLNTNMKPYSTIVKSTEPFTPVRGLFSTKEKAEEWIVLNKPCLSIKEILPIIGKCNETTYVDLDCLTRKIKELVKSKL